VREKHGGKKKHDEEKHGFEEMHGGDEKPENCEEEEWTCEEWCKWEEEWDRAVVEDSDIMWDEQWEDGGEDSGINTAPSAYLLLLLLLLLSLLLMLLLLLLPQLLPPSAEAPSGRDDNAPKAGEKKKDAPKAGEKKKALAVGETKKAPKAGETKKAPKEKLKKKRSRPMTANAMEEMIKSYISAKQAEIINAVHVMATAGLTADLHRAADDKLDGEECDVVEGGEKVDGEKLDELEVKGGARKKMRRSVVPNSAYALGFSKPGSGVVSYRFWSYI
jgi:hypothetical protein